MKLVDSYGFDPRSIPKSSRHQGPKSKRLWTSAQGSVTTGYGKFSLHSPVPEDSSTALNRSLPR